MITFVCTKAHRYPLMDFLYSERKEIRRLFRVIPYATLLRKRWLKTGTVIFSDLERLSPDDLDRVGGLSQRLRVAGVRVLNDPAVSCRRYELLKRLHDAGINPHAVDLLTEGRPPANYPVFIRRANDHQGSLTSLLSTPAEYTAAVEELSRRGQCRDDKLVVEFCDTRGDDGWYRKYAAFRVGDSIIPRHLLLGNAWGMKHAFADTSGESADEEWEYVRNNPHEAELMRIFELAGIQYGRIDYGLRDGRPVVWEINTNPALTTLDRVAPELRARQHIHYVNAIHDAFAAIDGGGIGRIAVRRRTPCSEWLSGVEQWLHTRFPSQRPRLVRLTRRIKPALKSLGMVRKPSDQNAG